MPKKGKKTEKSWRKRLKEKQIRHQRALETHRIQMERSAAKKPRRWSRVKILGAICLVALVFGVFAAWQYTQPQNQTNPPNTHPTQPTIYDAVYLRADGSIEPETAPILKVKDTQYKFTADIYLPIIVERDNIVIDGGGYTLKGTNVYGSRGIDLTDRKNVTVKNLTIKGFDFGVYMVSTSENSLLQNNLTENYCGVWLSYSTSNNIASNWITRNEGYGIWIKNSSSNTIYENKITLHSNYTIYIGSSKDNIIRKNLLANNTLSIFLYKSDNNTLYENNVAQNHVGIHVSSSSQNLIVKNSFESNDIGLDLSEASSNTIYHNNFINNTDQVFVSNSANTWDDGKEGNYWSDYKDKYPEAEELDGLGIWNKAYIIDDNNRDRYPKTNLNV